MKDRLRPLNQAPPDAFRAVRFLLTDMDETLTRHGRLSAATYDALERLQDAGVVVMPVTAAPAGWCDQMARMWPVDAVIAENGGVLFRRDGHDARRTFWSASHEDDLARLQAAADLVRARMLDARLASDQSFRLTTLAFEASGDAARDAELEQAMQAAGLQTTRNNLWVLGWVAGFDKLHMARRALADGWGLDIARDGDAVLYTGDSANDAPMFEFFRHTVGVSTVRAHLDSLPVHPAWITQGPGGAGFVEAADAVLRGR